MTQFILALFLSLAWSQTVDLRQVGTKAVNVYADPEGKEQVTYLPPSLFISVEPSEHDGWGIIKVENQTSKPDKLYVKLEDLVDPFAKHADMQNKTLPDSGGVTNVTSGVYFKSTTGWPYPMLSVIGRTAASCEIQDGRYKTTGMCLQVLPPNGSMLLLDAQLFRAKDSTQLLAYYRGIRDPKNAKVEILKNSPDGAPLRVVDLPKDDDGATPLQGWIPADKLTLIPPPPCENCTQPLEVVKARDQKDIDGESRDKAAISIGRSLMPYVGICTAQKDDNYKPHPTKTTYDHYVKPVMERQKFPENLVGIKTSQRVTRGQILEIDALARTIYGEMSGCFDIVEANLAAEQKKRLISPAAHKSDLPKYDPKSKRILHSGPELLMAVAAVSLRRMDEAADRLKTELAIEAAELKKQPKPPPHPNGGSSEFIDTAKYKSDLEAYIKKNQPDPPSMLINMLMTPKKFSAWDWPPKLETPFLASACPPKKIGGGANERSVEIFQECVQVATQAVLDKERFQERTKDITAKWYTSNLTRFHDMKKQDGVVVEAMKLPYEECMQLWDEDPKKKKQQEAKVQSKTSKTQ